MITNHFKLVILNFFIFFLCYLLKEQISTCKSSKIIYNFGKFPKETCSKDQITEYSTLSEHMQMAKYNAVFQIWNSSVHVKGVHVKEEPRNEKAKFYNYPENSDFYSQLLLLLLFSHQVVSDSLQLYGRQHARLPSPSLSPDFA